MQIITQSQVTIWQPMPNDTIVVAPGVQILGLSSGNTNNEMVNYGSLFNNFSSVGAVAPNVRFFSFSSGGTFINRAEGVVIHTNGENDDPAVLIESSATVINEGTMLNDSSHGISVSGSANNDSIVNSGDIYAKLNGVWVSSSVAQNVTITNSGEIKGDANGIYTELASGAAPVIINTGVITGRTNSIVATSGDRLNVSNYGTLNGDVFANSTNQTDSVFNNGRIVGNVHLGSGIDGYRGAGTVTGIVFGEAGNDALAGGNAADQLDGGTENDTLTGNGGNDFLNSGFGNDTLFGGLGKDTLFGGGNADFFVFNTALNASTNRDIIGDFSHVDDTFKLENAIFTKLGAGVHALSPLFFRAGTKALDANDYIVYNQSTGVLSYDNDGNGAHAPIAFAVLSNHAALAYNDFLVF
jgi:Ca2+-binding RTX toxin-like protein